jgi:glycosyltransferase involved in cell wall biosynthesis
MILEGSYPYITGGVSAWVQDIIKGLPDVDFALFTISPQTEQTLRYQLPPNIKEHRNIVLGDRGSARRGAAEGKAAVAPILAAHAHMFAKGRPDIGAMIASIPEGYDLTEDSVREEGYWSLIQKMNEERNPAYPFSDYFWAWESAHGMLFDALRASPPEADIYHAISTGFAGLVALAARVRRKKPFLLTEHGLYHKEREIEIRKSSFIRGYQRDMWIKVYNRISEICYREADGITALFEENRRKQLDLGADPAKCTVIPNGIDVDRFSSVVRSPRPGFHVGLVGRVVPIKDIKTFIAVAKIVLDRIPEARFYAIGPVDEDPEYNDECVALVENLRIADRFEFTGRQNVLEYYSFLDLMLLTSVREAQPLVIMEGWAAGVPSISTKVGNAPEMLDYEERFLAPSKDAARIAESVIWVRDHPEEMVEVNRRNREKAIGRYDKRDMLASFLKLYQQIVKQGISKQGKTGGASSRG